MNERTSTRERRLAVAAETLFLVNLMLAPGLAFLVLAGLWWRFGRAPRQGLGGRHLHQTFVASLWAGGLLVVAVSAMVLLGGWDSPWTWMVAILWFVTVHASLILGGAMGLARALDGRPWRYPLIGPREA